MEKNTGKVREFCQHGKVGTLVKGGGTMNHNKPLRTTTNHDIKPP